MSALDASSLFSLAMFAGLKAFQPLAFMVVPALCIAGAEAPPFL
jgi:hypothetical protein